MPQSEQAEIGERAAASLLETANPLDDPEGLITKFVAYECYRNKREDHQRNMVGSLQDRLGVLFWYLGDYVRDRLYAWAVPLSHGQISYLNGPAPLAGASPAITVALHNFLVGEKLDLLDLSRPDATTKAVYWWCVEKAPHSHFEDRLVTPDQIAMLRAERQWLGEDYPSNAFMSLYFERHAELHDLDMRYPRDRAAYFHYLVLLGFSQPHLLRLLPVDALRRTLQARYDGELLFDRILARHALAGAAVSEGTRLRRLGETAVRRAGYSLAKQPFSACRDMGGRPSSNHGSIGRVEPGVAVIGPIRKTSGLGQATRMSYKMLRHCERSAPTALPLEFDNPSPAKSSADLAFEAYAKPREVNLIHLNADCVPLAFAFGRREIFASSYNIGFVFWELNVIPPCQDLALELLDEIWVASEYNREIYSRYTNKPVINVGMAVETAPHVAPLDRGALGLSPDAFVFVTTFDAFSFIQRKNPLGSIKAFQAAFPLGTEHVQLVVKTQNRGRVYDPFQLDIWTQVDRAAVADSRIVIINDTFEYADQLGLILTCDCYVSLHRSEGCGFGLIEAMQMGCPVIATDYSGTADFCTSETAFLVDYRLCAVREREYIHVPRESQWAEPSTASAARIMRHVASDVTVARQKTKAAKALIDRQFSLAAGGRRYAERLGVIRNSISRSEASA